MKTLTRNEIVVAGGMIQEAHRLLPGIKHTGAYLNGSVYKWNGLYQERAGNQEEYQLFELLELTDREPFLEGVRYYASKGEFGLELEYPVTETETSARNILSLEGFKAAGKKGIHVYILGSDVSLKGDI